VADLSEICGLKDLKTSGPILVIDEIPLLSVGIREIFRPLDPSIRVEQTDSVYTVLSSKAYDKKNFDLIILSWSGDNDPDILLRETVALKAKFAGSRVMIYTERYDHTLITRAGAALIDACVHKFEAPEEILAAYTGLTAGTTWLSPIFDALYNTYRLNREEPHSRERKK
jgi:DNA-binding NarL/FixJ family response regulator